MKKLFWGWVSVSLVMMLVFGGHSTAAPAASREQQLYEAAKKEGIVWFQTGVPTDRWAPFINHFQKKYPGIKLEMMNVRGTDIATRVITEASAGKLTIDVILNNIQQILPLIQRDLLVKIPDDVWAINKVDIKNVFLDSRFAAAYDTPPIWMYNSSLVKPADVPKNINDLLKPMFRGNKIVLTPSGSIWGYLWPDWKAGNKQKVIDWVKKLREQNPLIAQSLVGTPTTVATGEALLGITFAASYLTLPSNTPVKIAPITPTYATPHGVDVLKGAAHPNAALLLASFAAGPEAQPVYWESLQGPTLPCDAGPLAKVMCAAGVSGYRITTPADVALLDELGNQAFDAMGWKP
jgi:iron(III) transport system substrate-binding protein